MRDLIAKTRRRDGNLNLYGQNITHDELKLLCDKLKTDTSVSRLCLSYNLLGDAAAMAVAEALKTNTTLQILYLDNNRLGDASAIAVAEVLIANTTLRSLYLDYNPLGPDAAMAFAKVLRHSCHLTVLSGVDLSTAECREVLGLGEKFAREENGNYTILRHLGSPSYGEAVEKEKKAPKREAVMEAATGPTELEKALTRERDHLKEDVRRLEGEVGRLRASESALSSELKGERAVAKKAVQEKERLGEAEKESASLASDLRAQVKRLEDELGQLRASEAELRAKVAKDEAIPPRRSEMEKALLHDVERLQASETEAQAELQRERDAAKKASEAAELAYAREKMKMQSELNKVQSELNGVQAELVKHLTAGGASSAAGETNAAAGGSGGGTGLPRDRPLKTVLDEVIRDAAVQVSGEGGMPGAVAAVAEALGVDMDPQWNMRQKVHHLAEVMGVEVKE